MSKAIFSQFVAATSIGISVGIAVIPSIFRALRRSEHLSPNIENVQETRSEKTEDGGTMGASIHTTKGKEADPLINKRIGGGNARDKCSDLQTTNCTERNWSKSEGFKSLLKVEFHEKNIGDECSLAMEGVFRRSLPIDSDDCSMNGDTRSGSLQVMKYMKSFPFNILQNCSMLAVQNFFGEDCLRHQQLDTLNDNGAATNYEAPTEYKECRGRSISPEKVYEIVSSLDSNNENYAKPPVSLSHNLIVEEIDITEGSGQLRHYKWFQRFLNTVMKIFLMDINCDAHPLTSFVRRFEAEMPRSVVLEISTNGRAQCELRMCGVQNLAIGITLSVPLRYFQQMDPCQTMFAIDNVEESLTFFFEILVDYLLFGNEP